MNDRIKKFTYQENSLPETLNFNKPTSGTQTHVAKKSITFTENFEFKGTSGTFTASIDNNFDGASDGFYDTGELWLTETTDEHGYLTVEGKDKLGQVVIKRVQNGVDEVKGLVTYHDTYYSYDIYGNLVLVIPPLAVERIGSSSQISQSILDNLCYQYHYDTQNRMISKKIPGKGWEYMVYDQWDRLVLTQDANLRKEKKWLFTKYDALNRPVMTGLKTISGDIATIRNSVEGNTHHHGSSSYPSTSGATILSKTYYDNYDWLPSGYGFSLPPDIFTLQDGEAAQGIEKPSFTNAIKGQITGSEVRVLGTDDFLTTVTYYDDKYRVTQTITESLDGGKDRMTSQYNFVGEVVKTYLEHDKGEEGSEMIVSSTTVLQENEYDHIGRLMKVYQTLNDDARKLLIENQYNELGELVTKTVNPDEQPLIHEYKYNIRGWLLGVNEDAGISQTHPFSYTLEYDAAGQYNGNIGKQSWSSFREPGNMREYTYTYDPLNRLKTAIYSGIGNENYSVTGNENGISYDANGNILHLQRNGLTNKVGDGNNFGSIDNLSYTYAANSNKLIKVTDGAKKIGSNFKEDHSFYDGANSNSEYQYDANGSLTYDGNKGISKIEYNHLNLPTKVHVTGGTVEYIYDAAGIKLQKIATINGKTKTTDYIGGFVYENNALQFMHTAEGRALAKSSGVVSHSDNVDFVQEYHYKDHLGNLRAAVRPNSVYYENFDDDYSIFDNADKNLTTLNYLSSSRSQLLTGEEGKTDGASIVLKLDEKESFTASVSSIFYNSNTKTTTLSQTSQSSGSSYSSTGENTGSSGGSVSMSAPVANVGTNSNGTPKAYLKIYFLPSEDGSPLGSMEKNVSVETLRETLSISVSPDNIPNGTKYFKVGIYNTSVSFHVYFDDLKIVFDDYIVQENHYYPFGMNMAGIEKKGTPDHKFQYNGKEKQEEIGFIDYGARHYDASLGRFFTQDRFAEKYYSLNPYQYVANNALNGIDVNGDSIWVVVSKAIIGEDGNSTIQKDRYYYGQDSDGNYGFIDSSGNLYSGSHEFLGQVSSAIGKLREGEVGRSLVDDLVSSTNNTIISKGSENKAEFENGKYIKWNPTSRKGGPDQDNNTRSPFIGLGHEMAHVQDIWNGTIDRTDWVGGISKAEIYATHVENQIRSEHGEPLRTHYALTPHGSPYGPSKIIDGNGASVFYKRTISTTIHFPHLEGQPYEAPETVKSKIPFKY